MYCAVFSFKNWYDAKDMRGTGGNDVNFAMDAPKVDSPDIAELRDQGRDHLRRRDRGQRRRRIVADRAGEAEDEHAVRST